MRSRYEDGRSAILLLQERREDFEANFEADVYCSEAWGRRHSMQQHANMIQIIAYYVSICSSMQWKAGAKWLEGEDGQDCIMGVGGGRHLKPALQ
jgi:hypothetical protein